MAIQTKQLHGTSTLDWVDLEDRAAGTFALANGETSSAALDEGVYHLYSDIACNIKIGPGASGVTAATGLPLFAAAPYAVVVLIRQGSRINAIAAAPGTLKYHMVA